MNHLSSINLKRYLALAFLSLIIVSCSAQKEKAAQDQLNAVPYKNQVGAMNLPDHIAPVDAPFLMPQFKKPSFPALTRSIRDRGAKEGIMATKEIQGTIDDINSQGGGTAVIPKGKWLTGRISLKSNVNLHLEEGAELYFSGEINDYLPAVFTRNEGIEVMSLGACIYANGQENIALTGKGRLIGPAQNGSVRKRTMTTQVIEEFVDLSKPVSQRIYEGQNGSPILPPMFISPINCKNVYIEGVSLENTAFWNIVPIYCEGVIIRGVTVNSVGIPRGDGIDIESSKNVLIEYSTLSSGDDCFTIKAGRGEDGIRVNKASENIVIRYCLAMQGHGAITVGSETAGMIRNVYVHDCVFDETGSGIRFKTRRPRGGGAENIYYNRIRMSLTGNAFNWDMLGSAQHVGELANRLPAREINELTPVFKNIVARNIVVERSSQFVKVTGIPETPLSKVLIENADIKSDKLFTAADINDFKVKNARIQTKDPNITLLGTRKLTFESVQFLVPGDTLNVSALSSEAPKFIRSTPKIFRP
ncbi:glycoside hydrolase family 28 protein [Pedobacter immunditicola]|uniref:glycoside hydrolase family 28 protein n=1 Tax=Pedobacter immunditicola TaxID=3133440 RepID=UPI00309D2D71